MFNKIILVAATVASSFSFGSTIKITHVTFTCTQKDDVVVQGNMNIPFQLLEQGIPVNDIHTTDHLTVTLDHLSGSAIDGDHDMNTLQGTPADQDHTSQPALEVPLWSINDPEADYSAGATITLQGFYQIVDGMVTVALGKGNSSTKDGQLVQWDDGESEASPLTCTFKD